MGGQKRALVAVAEDVVEESWERKWAGKILAGKTCPGS